jgi:hypothetical protein
MGLWLFKFDQPRGFDAMRAETEDFTRIASHVRVTAAPGDRVVIYNIADQHLAAVLTITGEAWKRTDGEDLERWPYAVSTRPEILSSRGPKWPVAGRNFRRLDETEFAELEAVVRLNRG